MHIAQTPRLLLRSVTLQDARFIQALMNEPSYHRFIGDRKIIDIPAALDYIQTRFLDSYENLGFGLYAVVLHGEKEPAGLCGLVKREHLPVPDLGFAFFPSYWSRGIAQEAATATLEHARLTLKLQRLLAVTTLDNDPSIRLLERLGFLFQETVQFPDNQESLKLFARSL